MKEKIHTYYMFNDFPICPHCYYGNSKPDASDITDDLNIEMECDACGQTYFCSIQLTGTYSTRKQP